MKDLRIVFMGTPDFAVASLDILIKNNYTIVGVVTMPDKPAGRGQQLQQSAIKKYATEKGLKILQPEKLKSEFFISDLKALNADLQIVVAFRMLPEVVWGMPRLGTFNLHGSLLPQYRGAAPINWAIINGETETGVTTFFLQHKIDTGKIIFNAKTPIGPNETVGDIHDRLMHIGADLVLKTVKAIEENKYLESDQSAFYSSETELKHAPKIFKEDCTINWSQSCTAIHNHIRGLSPYPSAFTEFKDPNEKLFFAKLYLAENEITPHKYPIKSVFTDGKSYLKIAVMDGFIFIKELQIASKKRMGIQEFLRGFPINDTWKVV